MPAPRGRDVPSVLVVDDEPTICRALQIALQRTGLRVVAVESGETALTLLRNETFDALVVDFRIPDLRGDVLYQLAASIQPHLRTRTLFTTGDASPRTLELIANCGCPVLGKPFELSDLLSFMRSLLESSREETA